MLNSQPHLWRIKNTLESLKRQSEDLLSLKKKILEVRGFARDERVLK